MSDGTESRRVVLMQNRRRALVTGTAYGAFVVVMGAVEALAVRGQLDFGRHVLGLAGAWLAVVPVALEAGALTWAALALWQTLTRDSGTAARAVTRLGTVVAIAAAAAANWLGAEAAGRSLPAANYLAGASVMALAMWHVILHGVRHAELRAAGAIEPPLPRFRALRWLVSLRETAQAYALAIREGITSPSEAITRLRELAVFEVFAELGEADVARALRMLADRRVRMDRATLLAAAEKWTAERAEDEQQAQALDPAEAPRALEAPQQSNYATAQERKSRPRTSGGRRGGKSEALRAVFDELGEADVPRAKKILAGRGVEMDHSAMYAVARKWEANRSPAAPAPLVSHAADGDYSPFRLEESA